jgi:hypothetical protein
MRLVRFPFAVLAVAACHHEPIHRLPTPAVEDEGKPPLTVAPDVVEHRRIAGSFRILPDEAMRIAMFKARKSRVVAMFTVCLSATGAITEIRQDRKSDLPDYDDKIQRVIRETWRYRPFEVNGKPAPICTAVTFIYSQPLGNAKP